MADEVQRKIKNFQPSNLANMAWAFSRNNFPNEKLIQAIASEAAEQVDAFKPSEVSMLTWSFAVVGFMDKNLMAELGAKAARSIGEFTGQQLSHMAWCFGVLSLRHSEFLEALAKDVYTSPDKFKAQHLTNIAWAFAMVRVRDAKLLKHVAPTIIPNVDELKSTALVRCAWGYRALLVTCPDLISAVAQQAWSKSDDFSTKSLVKLVDSIHTYPAVNEYHKLKDHLESKTAELAKFLTTTWCSAESFTIANAEAYQEQLQALQIPHCGAVGTAMLLRQMDFDLPDRNFVRRVRSRAWRSQDIDTDRSNRERDEESNKDFAVAEFEFKLGDKTSSGWVVRYQGDAPPGRRSVAQEDEQGRPVASKDAEGNDEARSEDGEGEEASGSAPWPWPVFVSLMPGKNGADEPIHQVIKELCNRISRMGVQNSIADERSNVEGVARLFTNMVPCLACAGSLQQFRILFPEVTLELAEQMQESE